MRSIIAKTQEASTRMVNVIITAVTGPTGQVEALPLQRHLRTLAKRYRNIHRVAFNH